MLDQPCGISGEMQRRALVNCCSAGRTARNVACWLAYLVIVGRRFLQMSCATSDRRVQFDSSETDLETTKRFLEACVLQKAIPPIATDDAVAWSIRLFVCHTRAPC